MSRPLSVSERLVIVAFSVAAAASFLSFFWESLMTVFLPTVVLVYFVFSLVFSPRFIKIASGIMVIAGFVLLTTVTDPICTWGDGLNRSAGMLILFSAIPLLTEMFTTLTERPGPRERRTHRHAQNSLAPLLEVAGTQFALSLVMSIGALWITGPLFAKRGLDATTNHRGMSLGYSMNVTSSPFDVIVHTAILLSGITYFQFIGGAAAAILWYIIAFALVEFIKYLRLGKIDEDTVSKTMRKIDNGENTPSITWLLLAHLGLLFVVAIIGTALFSELPSAVVIGVLGGVYGMIWQFRTRGIAAIPHALRLVGNAIPIYSGFLPLLIAALFMGTVLPESPLSHIITVIAETVTGFPMYFSILFIIASTVLLAVFGVHMLVTIVIFGTVFTAETLGLTPLGFALVLIVSYVSSMNISPLVPFTALVATVTNYQNPLIVVRHILLPWCIVIAGTPLILMCGFSL